MWGWIPGGGSEGYPWNGLITLPRILTLRPDGRLGVKPAPELAMLRGKHHHFENIVLNENIILSHKSPDILENITGDCLEIIVEFELVPAHGFGLELRRSPDGKEKTEILYDPLNKCLVSGDKFGRFELLEAEETIKLHIFLDKSVIEIFANYRETLTRRIYPTRADSLGLKIFTRGGNLKVRLLDIWHVKSIW